MFEPWASEFADIPRVLAARPELRDAMLKLIKERPIAAKTAQGGVPTLRGLLASVVEGSLGIEAAGQAAQQRIPRQGPHAADNKLFHKSWGKSLVKTEFSRFYNQAALEAMLAAGSATCTIAHSRSEERGGACASLVGRSFGTRALLDNLVAVYEQGREVEGPKVPNHPNCSHVARPV